MNFPSPSMFLPLLRTSTSLTQIHQIHAQILIHGLPLQNHLLAKLADLNFIDYAHSVFDQIPSPTDFSWNSLIRGYTLRGSPHNSLFLYLEMLRSSIRPSNFTYPFVLKACSTRASIREGEQIHSHVFRLGFRSDIFVNNSLIDMYCKCCCLDSSRHVWDEMRDRDEVSWNSIISGYVHWGEVESARELFEEMPLSRNVVCWTAMINGYGREGNLVEMLDLFRKMVVSADEVEPNSATMVCLLSACSSLSNFEVGRWVSIFIDVNKIPLNTILCTALIDMYSKCGDVEKAQRLFDGISCKNLASWNAIITGYVQCGLFEEAIQLFYHMQEKFVKPDEITMVNVLSACAGLGALKLGREVHCYLGRNGLELNVILATALVGMYSKCGKIDDACLVFVKTSRKDVALWNAMILGLAYHGNGRDSLAVLTQMERDGYQPNDVTFIGILSACNHSGLAEEGRIQFSNMINKYGLSPKVEHYSCMVDLLGRAGHLDEAYEMVQNMVVLPDSIIWGALLSACRIHRNLKLADKIGEIITSSEDPNLGFCVLLSNIYASVGRWKDVARMRRLVKDKRIKKPSGCSWIEVGDAVHRFVVEDSAHVKSQEIYETHWILVNHLKVEGYVPNFDSSLKNIDSM
ncbi:hypothetical protein L1049_016585 [Liquidambar formosana]|uniref:Pentatricopeptide repeat-containing protein n=1 Tax=Liquidambar formosana TaxID=63359 RepID=A0AAP0S6C4_LIQFO